MATKLTRPVTREVRHRGERLLVTLDATEVRFRVRGRRKVYRLPLDQALSIAIGNRLDDRARAGRFIRAMYQVSRRLAVSGLAPRAVKQMLAHARKCHLMVNALEAAGRVDGFRRRADRALAKVDGLAVLQMTLDFEGEDDGEDMD